MMEELNIFSSHPLHTRYMEEDLGKLKMQLKDAEDQDDKKLERTTCNALGTAYLSLDNYKLAVQYLEKFKAKEIRDHIQNETSVGNTSWNLGIAHHSLGQFGEAITKYEEALNIAQDMGRKKCKEKIYESLGNTYMSAGKYNGALYYHKLSLDIAKRNSDIKGECRQSARLGAVYQMLKNYKEAIRYHEESRHIASMLGNKDAEAIAYCGLGKAYFSLKNYREASRKFKKCQAINKSLVGNNTTAMSDVFLNLGNVYYSLGTYKTAVAYHEKSLNNAREKRDQGHAYSKLGDDYLSLGNYDDAINNYQNSLRIAMEIRQRIDEGRAYEKIGDVFLTKWELDKARAYYEKSLAIAVETDDKKNQGIVHSKLGGIFHSLKMYNKAIENYNEYISAAEIRRDTKAKGMAKAALGDVYHSLNQYRNAMACYETYLGITIQCRDRNGQINAHNGIGNISHSCCKYKKSIYHHEKSLTIAEKIKDKKSEGRANMCLGTNYQSLERYTEANDCFKKALANYKKIGDRGNKRKANEKLGVICQLTGKYKDAIKYYQQAVQVNFPDDKQGEAELYENFGIAYQSLHKYDMAVEYFEKSLNIAREILDKTAEVSANSNLGKTNMSSGNHLKALEYFERNLSTDAKGNAYLNLGNVYFALGEHNEANDYYKKYLKVAESGTNLKMKKIAHHQLGKVYQSLGKFEESISHFEEGLEISDKCGNVSKGNSYGNLGKCYYRFTKYEEAIKYHKMQLQVSKKIQNKFIEGDALVNLGNASLALGDYDNAKECLKKFQEITFGKDEMKSLVQNYSVMGVAYRKVAIHFKGEPGQTKYHKNMENSFSFLRKSLSLSEKQIDNLQDQEHFKISIVDTFIETYKQLAVSFIQIKKLKQALVVCDSGRARALRDLLISKYGLTSQASTKSDLQKYSSITSAFRKGKSSVLFYALTQDSQILTINVLPNQQEPICSLVNDSLRKPETKGQNTDCINEIVNLAYDQMKIKDNNIPDEEENENDEEASGNCSRETTTDTVVTTPQGKVKTKSGTSRTSPRPSPSALEILFERLVAPTQNPKLQQNLEEIVIIPDGPLNRVPFAALLDKSGKYLSETKRIRLAPSLTTLKILQECSKSFHCKTGALIIGNPDVGKVSYKGKLTRWKNLNSAEDETNAISVLLTDKTQCETSCGTTDETPVTALIGSQATKEVILQKFQEGVAVIHIAAHGLSNHGEIVLAPSATANNVVPKEKDYILTMKEVQDIGFRAKLVVLSCCYSGRGDIKAEGVIGMSRAFLAAGARAVVATLWAIDDEATQVFMIQFYSCLKEGKSASVSLQQAMEHLRGENYQNPKYWAPFFLIGDDVIIFPKKKSAGTKSLNVKR